MKARRMVVAIADHVRRLAELVPQPRKHLGRRGQDVRGLPAGPRRRAARCRGRWRSRPASARSPPRAAQAARSLGLDDELECIEAGELSLSPSRPTVATGRRVVSDGHGARTSSRSRSVIVAASAATSAESIRRGRGDVDGELGRHPPGPAGQQRRRGRPRRTASRTLWVTKTTVSRGPRPDPLELVVEDVAGHGVERAERLVHQQDVGVLGEGPGQGHALTHATRQLVRPLVGEAAEVHELEQLRAPAPAARPWARRASLQRERHVLAGGEPREQRRLLEHQRRPARRPRPCPPWARRARRPG